MSNLDHSAAEAVNLFRRLLDGSLAAFQRSVANLGDLAAAHHLQAEAAQRQAVAMERQAVAMERQAVALERRATATEWLRDCMHQIGPLEKSADDSQSVK